MKSFIAKYQTGCPKWMLKRAARSLSPNDENFKNYLKAANIGYFGSSDEVKHDLIERTLRLFQSVENSFIEWKLGESIEYHRV